MALPKPVPRIPIIAVVEDNAAVRQSLRVLLVSRGFQVDEFAGRAELLAGLESSNYDCFVIDLKLEDSNGIDLLSTIRQQGFDQPAVLISGWESDRLEQLAQLGGFAAFVRKPMLETSLADVLKRILQDS